MKRPIALLVCFLLSGLLAAGCGALPARPQPAPAPAITPARTPAPGQTPVPQPIATAAPITDTLTLTWWTPEFLSPKAAGAVGPLLARQIADFEALHRGKVRVNTVIKARYGKGGLLDFLRTAQPVAPALLPDLIALDIVEVEQAATLGLIQPLDGLLSREITGTLYGFARQSGQLDGRTLAVLWVADSEHVIYDRDRLSAPPSTWAGVLSEKTPYLFPAGLPQSLSVTGPTEDVQPTFLAQYLSAGGVLDPRTRRLTVQEQPLMRVLSFYRDASEAGLLPKNAANLIGLDEAWNSYVLGGVAMANVSARRYLANRDALPNAGFALMPGWSNPAPPVAGGWALLITTTDPARQKAAADFVAWLMAPERAGALAQAAGWLPTSPQALATWGANPYFEFLDRLLSSAVPRPIGPEYASAASRMQKAVNAVLKGVSTPAEAAQAAAAAK
ncbi:MAG: extracellular solute-binding protein [Anaerolineae bacterium]|nr:extracellular solute-binding protein [Anaerolineae bacterium]